MSGPIALPVRVETVSNTHRLIDSNGRHWFSFFIGNTQGNPSPLPQIAAALNATVAPVAAAGPSEEQIALKTIRNRLLGHLTDPQQTDADMMWGCAVLAGAAAPDLPKGGDDTARSGRRSNETKGTPVAPPAGATDSAPAGEQRRCSRCHAPLDPLSSRWHCDGDRVQGRHGGWEHDCGDGAVAMAEPTPAEGAPGGERSHDDEWCVLREDHPGDCIFATIEEVRAAIATTPPASGEELLYFDRVLSALREATSDCNGKRSDDGRCQFCGLRSCAEHRELIAEIDALRAAPAEVGEELRLLRELERIVRTWGNDDVIDYEHLDVLTQLDTLRATRAGEGE